MFVGRCSPGGDRAFFERERWVGDNQIHVKVNDVTEALAGRARTERVVEIEQTGNRIGVVDVAVIAAVFATDNALLPLAVVDCDDPRNRFGFGRLCWCGSQHDGSSVPFPHRRFQGFRQSC